MLSPRDGGPFTPTGPLPSVGGFGGRLRRLCDLGKFRVMLSGAGSRATRPSQWRDFSRVCCAVASTFGRRGQTDLLGLGVSPGVVRPLRPDETATSLVAVVTQWIASGAGGR